MPQTTIDNELHITAWTNNRKFVHSIVGQWLSNKYASIYYYVGVKS